MKSLFNSAYLRSSIALALSTVTLSGQLCMANMATLQTETEAIHEDVAVSNEPKLVKSIFESLEIHFKDEKRVKAWAKIHSNFEEDAAQLKACINNDVSCSEDEFTDWTRELSSLSNHAKMDILLTVNKSVNALIYKSDSVNYGYSDYWATPSEMLSNGGDCEDFALLKYASLMALGFDSDDMRIVIGRLQGGSAHSVLTVKLDHTIYVLDSAQSNIFPAGSSQAYTPLYSVNLTDRWSHIFPRNQEILNLR